MPKLWQRSPTPSATTKATKTPTIVRKTTITLSGEELIALGTLLAAGRVLLQQRAPLTPAVDAIRHGFDRRTRKSDIAV